MLNTDKWSQLLAILLLIEDYCIFKDGGNSLYDWEAFL